MAYSKPSSFDPASRPLRFCDQIVEKHKCFHCSEVLLKPVQSFCGQRYCFSCKEELLAENRNMTEDEDDCKEVFLSKVFEDKGTVRDLSKLFVFCPNETAGCQETPTWKPLDVHLQNCEFAQKKCPSRHCTFIETQAMMQTHLATECEYILVTCELCQNDVPKQRLDSHYKLCSTQEHTCKYKRYGCSFRGLRDALLEHQSDSSLHFDMILNHGDEMEQKLDCVETDLKQCMSDKAEFNRQLQDMCNEINSTKHSTTHRINQQQEVLASCAEKIAVAENAIVKLSSTESIETQNKVIRDLQDVLKMLNGRLEYLEQAENTKSTPYVTSDGKVVALETTIHRLERQVFEDTGTARDLSKLLVCCPNQHAGCQETPTWKNLDIHLQSCEFAQERCPSRRCTFIGTLSMIQTHLQTDCEYVLVECELCHHDFPKRYMDSHYEICSTQEHTCQYKEYGCTFRGLKDALLKHQSDSSVHFDMIVKVGNDRAQRLYSLKPELKKCREEYHELDRYLVQISRENNLQPSDLASEKCPSRHCTFVGTQLAIRNHLQENCQNVIETCQLCGHDFKKQNMEDHTRICSTQTHACKYQKYGCAYIGSGDALLVHQRDTLLHFAMMISYSNSLDQEIALMKNEIDLFTSKKNDVLRFIDDLSKETNSSIYHN